MNILMLTRSLPFHQLGGMEIVVWDLARGFARQGANIVLVTTACERLETESTRDGVSLVTVPSPSGRYSRQWYEGTLKLYRDRYEAWADSVFSVSKGGYAIARATVSNRRRAPTIMQVHGTAWTDFCSEVNIGTPRAIARAIKNSREIIADRHYRYFDQMIAVGSSVYADLQSLPTCLVRGRTPVQLIANGLDEARFRFDPQLRAAERGRLQLTGEHRVVVSISRLHAQKGLAQSLAGFAVAARTDPHLRYVIVGSGPEEAVIREQVRSLGLMEKVTMVGAVDRADIQGLLSAADAFLFTTLRVEGLPTNVLEALANGLVPIASRVMELHGFAMVCVDPHDPGSVAAGIRKAVGANGDRHTLLSSEFSLDRSVHCYMQVLDGMRSQMV